jgi:hypothetical protein
MQHRIARVYEFEFIGFIIQDINVQDLRMRFAKCARVCKNEICGRIRPDEFANGVVHVWYVKLIESAVPSKHEGIGWNAEHFSQIVRTLTAKMHNVWNKRNVRAIETQ